MRRIGKNWRKYVTFLVMALFALAIEPGTMAVAGAAPHANMTAAPHAGITASQNTAATPVTPTLHSQKGCCGGMMLCPGLLACHGISMMAAALPVHFQSIQTFVPAGTPEKLSGRLLAPTDPPPIV